MWRRPCQRVAWRGPRRKKRAPATRQRFVREKRLRLGENENGKLGESRLAAGKTQPGVLHQTSVLEQPRCCPFCFRTRGRLLLGYEQCCRCDLQAACNAALAHWAWPCLRQRAGGASPRGCPPRCAHAGCAASTSRSALARPPPPPHPTQRGAAQASLADVPDSALAGKRVLVRVDFNVPQVPPAPLPPSAVLRARADRWGRWPRCSPLGRL